MAGNKFSNRASLTLECLEERAAPAYLSAGNLMIVGSNAVDHVVVKDVTINGLAKIQVNHNGFVQNFSASSVTGKVMFWGYGGNDFLDYYGYKSVALIHGDSC